MPVPEFITQLAEACNFTVHGWDDDEDSAVIQSREIPGPTPDGYGVERPSVNFIGTHAECHAFMTAWQQCIQHKLTELMAHDDKASERIRSTILIWDSPSSINPGESVQLQLRPQRGPFRGERLAVPANIAEHFSIVDLKVGNRSQTQMYGDIPCVAFAVGIDTAPLLKATGGSGAIVVTLERQAQKEFGRKWLMETAQVAMDMVLVVRNTSVVPYPFTAMVLGKSAATW